MTEPEEYLAGLIESAADNYQNLVLPNPQLEELLETLQHSNGIVYLADIAEKAWRYDELD